jgi:hypothetical protein
MPLIASLTANLLKIHKISSSEVLDISKKPNFRVQNFPGGGTSLWQNHESTSFDRSYYG